MDIVKKCKDVWCSATSETEQFRAVHVIIKLAGSSTLSCSQKKEIFDIVGFCFVSHLLQDEKMSQSCSLYKSVAVSFLAFFSSEPEIATSDQLCDLTGELKNILNADVELCSGESLVIDVLACIYNMAKHEKSRKHLFENDIISCLVKLYIIDSCEKDLSLQILKYLSFYFRSETNESDYTAFEFFLLRMAKDHSDYLSSQLCVRRTLFTILCDPLGRIQGDEDWALEFQEVLIKVLKAKASKELRDLAIKLASLMIEKYGIFWIGGGDVKNRKVFFLVLVQSVCLEVRYALEHKTVKDILKETFVLSACLSIFEVVISAMGEDSSFHPFQPFLKQLKTSLQTAYKSIINFLFMMSKEWSSVHIAPEFALIRELTYASIRVLCVWLFEETHVLQEEVCEVIPFVLRVCNECYLSFQSADTLCSDSQVSHVDLMRNFLLCLDRLILDDDLRATLLEQGLVDIMFQYMLFQWALYQKNQTMETESVLCTVCMVVLTVVCMDARIVPETEVFFSFLKFLLSVVPVLSPNYENLCLKANFAALGLLITKHHYKRIKSCETSFYRFLSFSIKFLWDSHHVEDGNDSISFVLGREYRHVWSSIMEPWFLGMHALSMLLPLMPWITDFLMESGWPQHIITSLTRVNEKGIEGSVKYAYQAFLSSLVRVSMSAVQTLNDCEALYVCKKHNLKELEALLHR